MMWNSDEKYMSGEELSKLTEEELYETLLRCDSKSLKKQIIKYIKTANQFELLIIEKILLKVNWQKENKKLVEIMNRVVKGEEIISENN